ncbi:hypothetical protein MMC07_005752 [Pseudocyphellaria aurata]|nr:hypothetical protein [Pseudocyphellaria aurata]
MSNSPEASTSVHVKTEQADEITNGNSVTEEGQKLTLAMLARAAELEMNKTPEQEPAHEATDVAPKKRGPVDGNDSDNLTENRSLKKGKTVVAAKAATSFGESSSAGAAENADDNHGHDDFHGDPNALELIFPMLPAPRDMEGTASTALADHRPTTNARGEIRQRQAPMFAIAPAREIPSSYEEADEADRLLLDMRDSGVPWKIIRAAWTEKTRQPTGGSTLPNRYKRIKNQMMRLEEGDAERLLAAAAEVEAEFKATKFALMAAKIEAAGGATYSAAFLQKQLKELTSKGKGKRVSAYDDLFEDEDDEEDE